MSCGTPLSPHHHPTSLISSAHLLNDLELLNVSLPQLDCGHLQARVKDSSSVTHSELDSELDSELGLV